MPHAHLNFTVVTVGLRWACGITEVVGEKGVGDCLEELLYFEGLERELRFDA